MEINFVTGKGGVGKSVVAAALALQRQQAGKRTLLVELGNQSFYKDFFGLPEVTYQPVSLRAQGPEGAQSPDVALWTGQECLREYARHLLKLEALYRLFFENPVTRTLVNVAPALPELAIMGKITSGPPRNVGPRLPYDCLVVDAYASGHFMALLKAPGGMAQAIKFGPMGEQSRGIDAILKDSQQCKYFVVSLPEEMPVLEAKELSDEIAQLTGIKAQQIINKTLPIKGSDTSAQIAQLLRGADEEFKKIIEEKIAQEKDAQEKLAGYPIWTTSMVFSSKPWSVVECLAKELAHA